jgi:methylenetetrahydrofolate dehydrogenase (NADP+)/methenyltetrahydrofolate cyclohydrolase
MFSPAVGVVKAVCEMQKYDLSLHSVAVVGLGLLVGRPIANWIMRKARETILFRSTSDLSLLRHADLVITGVGRASIIKPEMLKTGAAVIDFGYDNMHGDFDYEQLVPDDQRIIFYTPTPGGTGPILVAKLFENFFRLNAEGKNLKLEG